MDALHVSLPRRLEEGGEPRAVLTLSGRLVLVDRVVADAGLAQSIPLQVEALGRAETRCQSNPILQYRFAPPNPLKARPRPGCCRNRSFVQARPSGFSSRCSSPLSLINSSEPPGPGPEPSRARSEAKPIP